MAITAKQVKELREMTGAEIMGLQALQQQKAILIKQSNF